MRPTAILLCSSALVAACGPRDASTAPSTPSPAPRPASAAEPPAAPVAPAAPPIELHEWGLIDHAIATGMAELATGPGVPARPISVRKPVIYAHLGPGIDALRLEVRARIVGGEILEIYPNGARDPSSVAWTAEVRRGPCTTGMRAAPARDLATVRACAAPDGFCEIFELPRYTTDDHDCLIVNGVETGLLFYRGSMRPDALPISVRTRSDGSVDVTATRALEGMPGAILRIAFDFAGNRTVARANAPGLGQSVTIARPSEPLDPVAERAALERDLAELGMTPSETRAFTQAWATELFGPGLPAGTRRSAPGPAGRAAQPSGVLLYWLPPAAVGAIAVLESSPPASQRRAFLVRVDLGIP